MTDRAAAVARLYNRLREQEAKDIAALDKLGWNASLMGRVPGHKLLKHCEAVVDIVLEEDE
jgi:hypothetical protein